MPACTVLRTHDQGKRRHLRDADAVAGPVEFGSIYVPELNRLVECLRVPRGDFRDGRRRPDALPPLFEPQIRTLLTERGMMISGFEQIDGARYYQGWYIRWVGDDVRTDKAGEEPG